MKIEGIKIGYIKEEKYQYIKNILNKENDYFSKEELESIYKNFDVILT